MFQMSSGPQHKYRYKNVGLDSQELRRRREEEGVQLRKQKREQQLSKRRNVPSIVADDDTVSSTGDVYQTPTALVRYFLDYHSFYLSYSDIYKFLFKC